MSVSKKISFHTKQVSGSLGITDASDSSLERLVNGMISNYQEYKLEPRNSFKLEVKKALQAQFNNITPDITPSSTSVPAVMSLNQTLRNNYQNSLSKRQRPVDANTNIPIVDNNNIETKNPNNLNRPSPSSNKTINKKKKRLQLKSNDESDTSDHQHIHPDFDNNITTTTTTTNIPVSNLRPTNRLKDLAGLNHIIQEIQEIIFHPVQYPEIYHHLGVNPTAGLLLQGPSGCGKTSLALAIAGELNLPFFKVSFIISVIISVSVHIHIHIHICLRHSFSMLLQ